MRGRPNRFVQGRDARADLGCDDAVVGEESIGIALREDAAASFLLSERGFRFLSANGDLIGANEQFRLTADGKLRPCLLDNDEINIREPLRNGASIDELARLIQETALIKRKQHHLGENMTASTRPMRQIGG